MILFDFANIYPYLVAAHIVFVVTWFAALFYIVRLFIYHAEATTQKEPDRSILSAQFGIMEKRLMGIIGNPSMVLVLISGTTLLSMNSQFLKEGWMDAKLGFVLCLLVYHFYCLRIMQNLARNRAIMSSQKLRLLNELATVFLIAIVFLVELKNLIDMVWALCGLFLVMLILFTAVNLYKRARIKANKKAE